MLETACQPDLRHYPRIETHIAARLAVGDCWSDCMILDLSAGGARLQTDAELAEGATVILTSEEIGILAATVRRRSPDSVSLAFGLSGESKRALLDRLTRDLNDNRIG